MNKSTSQKKHVKIINIFIQFCNEDKSWLELIKKYYEPEAQFLYLLAPCLTYIYTKINDITPKNYLFLEQDRRNIILQRFKNHWLHKIIMCCVLELYDAKDLQLLNGESSEERFSSFILLLGNSENRISFLKKYIVIKNKLEIYLFNEVKVIRQLLHRLDDSFLEIRKEFLFGKDELSLKKILSSGDTHAGNSVSILEFLTDDGVCKRLVYKPRSLEMDYSYNCVLTWLNKFVSKPFYVPNIILSKNYGWYEFIGNAYCKNESEVQDYYTRLGSLLAVIYLLHGGDIHAENIIAFGEFPVIIDHECLFVPKNLKSKNFLPFQDRMYSVLNTNLLPQRTMVTKHSKGIDASGFSFYGDQEIPYQSICIENSGTDKITLVKRVVQSVKESNTPRILGWTIIPINYENFFISGFSELYNIVLNKKRYFLFSKKSPLISFKHATVRLLFRSTIEYSRLLNESYHPSLLSCKKKYRTYFKKWFLENQKLEYLSHSEIKQILNGDIPSFYIKVNKKTGIKDASGETIFLNFSKSGYNQVVTHVKNYICKNDLFTQMKYIEQSFVCFKHNNSLLMSEKIESNAIPERNFLSQIIIELLEKVQKHVQFRGDLLFWPNAYSEYETWNTGITTPWLYDGIAGIALCFSYLSHLLKKYNDLTEKCLIHIEVILQEIIDTSLDVPVGVFTGVGGFLYLYQMLKHMQYKEIISRILFMSFMIIEKKLFSKDKRKLFELDIILGLAGLLKVLTGFKDTAFESRARTLAARCVKIILLQYPNPSEFTEKTKIDQPNPQPLLGFSHGAAGIAWALFYYYTNFKKQKNIYQWIEHALEYERKHFSSEQQNWPSFGNAELYPIQWCHGAVGIGMARLDMYIKGWRDAYILDEIRAAVFSARKDKPFIHMNICHGLLGNLEFLEYAMKHNFLSTEEYGSHFADYTSLLVNAKSVVADTCNQFFIPGLMTGLTGVAYQLSKLQNKKFPSILLLATS